MVRPFHLAVPVGDLEEARSFYRDVLGCEEGRSSDKWVDFNFFGHQFVIHHQPGYMANQHVNGVDGKGVPVPHYGVVLSIDQFEKLADRMRKRETMFIIEPYTRFKGEVGEQSTMFFLDPSGNALEFKAFGDINQLFAI